MFAWEAAERGQEVHPIADPSQAEMLRKNFDEKKTTLKEEQKQRILDRYGGAEHLEVPDARLLAGQTENYVEYDRTGRIVKGAPKVRAVCSSISIQRLVVLKYWIHSFRV